MALKDIGKIVANQTALEKVRESEVSQSRPGLTEAGKAWFAKQDERVANIKPGTNKPVDVTGHRGFVYDSSNPLHKDLLDHLVNNGQADAVTINEGGVVSFPREVVMNAADETTSAKFTAATLQGKNEIRFGEATKVKPRKPESASRPSTRPSAPRRVPPARLPNRSAAKKAPEKNPLIEDSAEVYRNLFGPR